MKKTAAIVGLLALTLSFTLDSEAHAQRGRVAGGFRGRNPAFVGGFAGTSFSTVWDLYLNGDIPVPPYYALHPPVYYSAPIPRTYGYSPFAYPPSVMTPEIVDVEPLELSNPHVPASSITPAGSGDKTTQMNHRQPPLVLVNPYVTARVADGLEADLQTANLGR